MVHSLEHYRQKIWTLAGQLEIQVGETTWFRDLADLTEFGVREMLGKKYKKQNVQIRTVIARNREGNTT